MFCTELELLSSALIEVRSAEFPGFVPAKWGEWSQASQNAEPKIVNPNVTRIRSNAV
jgi:hypothetical protein